MVRPLETRCEHCGFGDTLTRVEVRHRKTGERRVLNLCRRCLERAPRTWRLTWEEVSA
jgi:hypothetical protein